MLPKLWRYVLAPVSMTPWFLMNAAAQAAIPDTSRNLPMCATSTGNLTLDDAMRLAAVRPLRNSTEIQYQIDIISAEQSIDAYRPKFTAYASSPGKAGIRGQWRSPWGTYVSADYSPISVNGLSGDAGSLGYSTTVDISQPLLRGRQYARMDRNRGKRAKYIAQVAHDSRIADDTVTIIQAFVDAIRAETRVDSTNDLLILSQKALAESAPQAGMGQRSAAERSQQLQLFMSQQDAQLNSAKTMRMAATVSLEGLIGCSIPPRQLLIAPVLPPAESAPATATPAALIISELGLADAQDALELARSERLPDLSLNLGWAYQPERNRSGYPGPALDRRIGLTLEIPLNDTDAKANYVVAQHRLELAKNDLAQAKLDLQARIGALEAALTNAKQQLQLASEQVVHANEVIASESSRFKSGDSTFVEWQFAATSQSASQLAFEEATLDVYLAQILLWHGRGELLDKLRLGSLPAHTAAAQARPLPHLASDR